MDDDHAWLTKVITDFQSNGLCPVDGPCEECDCFDPKHTLAAREARFILDQARAEGRTLR